MIKFGRVLERCFWGRTVLALVFTNNGFHKISGLLHITITIISGFVRLTNAFFNWLKRCLENLLEHPLRPPPPKKKTKQNKKTTVWKGNIGFRSKQRKKHTHAKKVLQCTEYCEIRDWHTYLHRLASSRSIFRSFDSVLVGYPRWFEIPDYRNTPRWLHSWKLPQLGSHSWECQGWHIL